MENVKERDVERVLDLGDVSPAARHELVKLGILSPMGKLQQPVTKPYQPGFKGVEKQGISAPSVLNEAFCYPSPSAFSRGLRLEMKDYTYLMISGTASVDEAGRTIYTGDFKAQCWRTYRNITELLDAEGASWRDVVKTTCYLRDIERDYKDFNEVRTAFFKWLRLDPLPASVGIQARLCREDLLVEIEGLAILKRDS
jgi:enamine deaminase RidA (YjgF/YER057c/UK114 family)